MVAAINYSKSVFLVCPDRARAIACTYDPDRPAENRTIFKTFDPDIVKDDLVIVPTNTRVGFTVCKVLETDVDLDINSPEQVQWIAGRFDPEHHKRQLVDESAIISQLKSALLRQQREELASALFKDQTAALEKMRLAMIGSESEGQKESGGQ